MRLTCYLISEFQDFSGYDVLMSKVIDLNLRRHIINTVDEYEFNHMANSIQAGTDRAVEEANEINRGYSNP